jgi:hypothetical protein
MLALYVKRLSMSIANSLKTTGNLNIRIHRDITGEMWFGVGYNLTPNFKGGTNNGGRSKTTIKKQ